MMVSFFVDLGRLVPAETGVAMSARNED